MTLVLRGSSPTVCAGPLLHPRPQLLERSRCGEPSGTEEATWAVCKPPGTVTLLRCLQNQNPDLENRPLSGTPKTYQRWITDSPQRDPASLL